jgi:hypothetical protein
VVSCCTGARTSLQRWPGACDTFCNSVHLLQLVVGWRKRPTACIEHCFQAIFGDCRLVPSLVTISSCQTAKHNTAGSRAPEPPPCSGRLPPAASCGHAALCTERSHRLTCPCSAKQSRRKQLSLAAACSNAPFTNSSGRDAVTRQGQRQHITNSRCLHQCDVVAL